MNAACGRPPHLWGGCRRTVPAHRRLRRTPTHVGKASSNLEKNRKTWTDPHGYGEMCFSTVLLHQGTTDSHVRGEECPWAVKCAQPRNGRPPHAWGAQEAGGAALLGEGRTPMCMGVCRAYLRHYQLPGPPPHVGNASSLGGRASGCRANPHAGGEDSASAARSTDTSDRPPRVRGGPLLACWFSDPRGSFYSLYRVRCGGRAGMRLPRRHRTAGLAVEHGPRGMGETIFNCPHFTRRCGTGPVGQYGELVASGRAGISAGVFRSRPWYLSDGRWAHGRTPSYAGEQHRLPLWQFREAACGNW